MSFSLFQLKKQASGWVTHSRLGMAAAFAAKILGAGLGFVFSIILARLLGPSGTGVYFLSLTIMSIGSVIARLGLDNAVLRFAAVAHIRGETSTLAALYRKSMGLVVFAGVTVTFLIWCVAPHFALGGNHADQLKVVLSVILLALIPMALTQLQGEFFKAIGSPGIATIIQAVLLPMFLTIGITVLFLKGRAIVLDVTVLYVISATASVLIAGLAWNRCKPGLWLEQGYFDTRLLLKTSLPLLWVASMNLVMGWTDILVLGFWEDTATVGVYGVVTRIVALTAFILIAVNSVTAPKFAALHAQGNHKAVERLAQRSAGWMLLAASPIILFLLLFPEFILQFFGADFVGGANLLRILALGQLANVAVGSVGYLLMMTGKERIVRNNIFYAVMVNVAGNIVLIPIIGAVGAALSTAIALIIKNVLLWWRVRKTLEIDTLFLSRLLTTLVRHK